jgi:AAA domain-containing protein/DnaB helicase-like protein
MSAPPIKSERSAGTERRGNDLSDRATYRQSNVVQVLPHSEDAEKGVLGSMMISPNKAIPESIEKLTGEHFYNPVNRTIFGALVDFYQSGRAVDLITFTQFLRDRNLLESVGGAGYVTELSTFVPTAANLAYYIDIVREKHTLRQFINTGTECARRAHDGEANVPELLTFVTEQMEAIQLNGSGSLPAIQDASALVNKSLTLPADIIEGVLHRGGKMVLGGASKSYKTWTLIDLAVSVATGSECFNGYPTKKGRVLYVNLEIQAAFFTKRIRAVCDERQLKLEPGTLDVWNLRGHALDWASLSRRIPKGVYVLIIIDPVYKLLHGRDENKAGDIASLLNEIELIAVRTGAAVAFGAHYSKGNQAQKESIDRIGGSGVFARDPDTILNFTKHEESDCFTVEMTLRNHPPREPFVVRWEYPLFVVDELLDPARLKQPGRPEQHRATDLLDLIDEPMSAKEIEKLARDELGIGRRRVFDLLDELKRTGRIKQPEKRGKYERI